MREDAGKSAKKSEQYPHGDRDAVQMPEADGSAGLPGTAPDAFVRCNEP